MTGPYTAKLMSAEIGAGDVGTGRFDSVYAEAKSALGYAANTLRALTEQYREAYHADLAAWHAEHDELDREELDALGPSSDNGTGAGEPAHSAEPAHSGGLRRTVALGASELRRISPTTCGCGSSKPARRSASDWPRRSTTARRRRS